MLLLHSPSSKQLWRWYPGLTSSQSPGLLVQLRDKVVHINHQLLNRGWLGWFEMMHGMTPQPKITGTKISDKIVSQLDQETRRLWRSQSRISSPELQLEAFVLRTLVTRHPVCRESVGVEWMKKIFIFLFYLNFLLLKVSLDVKMQYINFFLDKFSD